MTIKDKNKLKSKAKSKILVLGLILIILATLFSPATKVEASVCTAPNTPPGCTPGYVLLAPLPCESGPGCDPVTKTITTFDPAQSNNLGAYLNLMIKIFIGLCAVLAVVMIVVGGLEYMTTELISTKEASKERIRNAIFGLLLALGAYALLFTINPDLLKSDICISPQVIINGECVNPPPAIPVPTTPTSPLRMQLIP